MTYAVLKGRIKKRRFDPAYFFYGDNQFLIDELVQIITSAIIVPDFISFDRSVLHGDEIRPEAILNAVETPPMASPKRVVVLSRVDKLSEKIKKILLDYLEHPAPTTLLIVTAPKVDKKRAFYKRLMLRTTPIALSNLNEKETMVWIKERVSSLGWSIDSEGARTLYNSIGNDQSYLANEIDKLTLCAGEKRKITAEDVAAVAGKSRVNSIFDLPDAIGRMDCYQSIALVNNLLAWGQQPSHILAMILRHMLILLSLKCLKKRNASQAEMCRRHNLSSYYLGGYLKQSAMFTETALRRRIRLLQATEARLKSTPGKALELESLVYRMCMEDMN